LSGRHKRLDPAIRAQPLKVEKVGYDLAQRVYVSRIKLIGEENPSQRKRAF
jgi:hypothetical protein